MSLVILVVHAEGTDRTTVSRTSAVPRLPPVVANPSVQLALPPVSLPSSPPPLAPGPTPPTTTQPPVVVPATTATTTPAPTPVAHPPAAAPAPPPATPRSRAPTDVPSVPAPTAAAQVGPSVVATALVSSLPLYTAPGAPAPQRTMPNPNVLGATVVLLVKTIENGWIQAFVPFRPNGSTAWVPGADVSLSLDAVHIVVSLGARQLALYKGNVVMFRTPVAPGAPTSPTPTGLFFVTYVVRLSDPGSAYGPYALGLSGFSNTYLSFDGGPGQVAIHGTNQPWQIGQYASHGCVRVPNAAVSALAAQVPQGTPVVISN